MSSFANPEDRVIELLENGDLVAFVGAGVSIPPGKDWIKLVKELANRCYVSFKDTEPLAVVVDRCIAKNLMECNVILRELLPKHVAATRTAIGYLHRLKFRAMLTTNFDPWIRQQSYQQQYSRCHVYPHLPLGMGLDEGLYYLHGYFDSDKDADICDLVFSSSSFQQAYQQSLLPGFLLQIFSYSNILFVGFNPTEDNIQNLLMQSTFAAPFAASLSHRLNSLSVSRCGPNRLELGYSELRRRR